MSDDFRDELDELRQRIAQLEAQVSALSPRNVPSASQTAIPGIVASAPPASGTSIENKIGGQWLNRAGILAVLVGVALFLKLAIDNHWLGPAARVGVGLIGGLALYALSEVFRRRSYTGFAFSLKGIGSGALYLSLWAAYTLLHLLPAALVAAGMVLVTAGNGVLAWRQNSRLLAFYALCGGLLTPLLLADKHNHEVALFAYLLMIAAGTAILAALRRWHTLLLLAFLGNVLYAAFWAWKHYHPGEFAITLLFAAIGFALFSGLPILFLGKPARSGSLTALALCNAVAGIFLAGELFHGFSRVVVTLLLSVFYFLWARTRFGLESPPQPIPSWATVLNANAALLAGVSLAIHWLWHSVANAHGVHTGEDLSYSFWFMGFGAALVAIGFRRRATSLRWQGLVLLFFSIAKVFLFDIRLLSETSRVLSFLGLGLLLLVVSFVYQRDWLKLRNS